MTTRVGRSWSRLEAWLASQGADVSTLPGGTRLQDVQAAEAVVGQALPEELVESLRLHDGDDCIGILEWSLLSVSELAKQWSGMQAGGFGGQAGNADEGVSPVWWSSGWLPIAASAAGDLLCVDTTPTDVGTVGQVVRFWHDRGRRELVGASLGEVFEEFASRAEAGEYRYDVSEEIVMKR